MMKICVIGPQAPTQQQLLTMFRQRGDDIVTGEGESPPPAGVYLCVAITDAIKTATRGVVILDARPDFAPAVGEGAMYADICLVATDDDRLRLVDEFGCEPARIFVAADNHRAVEIIDRAARDTLLPAPALSRPQKTESTLPLNDAHSPDVALAQIRGRLRAIEQQADVVLRHYRVRSGAPLVGRFIVWLRRNLTSHLREPYLDPILNKQVAFNTQLVQELQTMLSVQADLLHRLEKLEQAILPDKNGRE